MNTLKEEKVSQKLASDNIRRDTVRWSSASGISPEEHSEYLGTMADHFFQSVTKLVEKAVSTQSKLSSDEVWH